MEEVKMDIKWITVFYFGISLIVLMLFGNRALFVGSILSYILVKRPPYTIIWLGFMLVGSIGITVFMKSDSSLGRLLIYKISVPIFMENWIKGCGLGEFGRVYLTEQAKYFSQPGFTNKELLLADNSVYAFNDWYQLICETGLFGIILIIIFCYAIFQLNNYFHNNEFFWYKVILLVIFTSALFTHLFEKSYIQLFIGIILFSMILKKVNENVKVLRIFFISILVLGGAREIKSIYRESWLQDSIRLSNSGQFYRANLLLDKLKLEEACGSECIFFYSRNLASLGRTDDALNELEKLPLRETNSFYFSLLAELYIAKHDFEKAENNLIYAIHMVPNRFEERQKLLELYQLRQDSINVVKVASAIANLPIKVNSDRIQFIKQYSTQILNTY